ncbi:sorting nexin-11 [Chaetodon trifascialis]|uniref:sorting nexin-11 n=1 Tax=Chaetodon trifascialis TaxID=109706 RepID=UPI0039942144
MISNQEDEFVAVRVQDPRIQNEGSWNSYVDYKIFLHTNSKAFTAKTSCVRRRYSEFAWLKKKLQKNAGLVPVPDLPGKSFFSFSNEDFLEGRRRGLQAFLDKVVHMTVCLSDSQLHLFLQTQLPVGHIQDCVQGHTPYSVTDAILTYASSNWGFAQAQEDDSIKEPSLTVSYESMESPAPHQPSIQTKETFSPELVSCPDSDPLEGVLQLCDEVTAESQHKETSSVRVLQRNNHLEAVVEDRGPAEASFFLGDGQDDPESPGLAAQTQQRSCQIQTPVEVHSPMGAGCEVNCGVEEVTLDAEKAVPHPDTEEDDRQESSEEAETEDSCETEKCDFKDSDGGPQEDALGDVCSEKQVSENQVISEVNGLEHVGGAEGHISDVSCPEEAKNSDGQKEPDGEASSQEETHLEIQGETHNVHSVSPVESGGGERAEQEVALFGTRDESDEDSHSLPSSNGSIVKVSDEDENEDSIHANNGYMKTSPEDVTLWTDVEASSRNILDLHTNGCSVEDEDVSTQEDEKLSKSLDLISSVTADLTENSDFSVLETSCSPGLADRKCTEQDTLSSLSVDASEDTHEVEAH